MKRRVHSNSLYYPPSFVEVIAACLNLYQLDVKCVMSKSLLDIFCFSIFPKSEYFRLYLMQSPICGYGVHNRVLSIYVHMYPSVSERMHVYMYICL